MLSLKEANEQLEALNAAVNAEKDRRRDWIVDNFLSFAEFQPGDKVYADQYETNSREYLGMHHIGTVTEAYLVMENIPSVSIGYRMEPAPGRYGERDTRMSRYTIHQNEASYQLYLKKEIEKLQKQLV